MGIDYGENLEPVLQKTEYAAVEIQPMNIHHRNSNRYYTHPPVSIDYAKNPGIVLQKIEYVATKIQPMDMHHRNSNRYIVFLWV